MAEAGIGAEVPPGSAPVCVYTGPTPAGPECGEVATVHVAAVRVDGGLASLHACDEHAAVARSVPRYFGEHPHRGWCGFPGSVWDEPGKRCVLDGSGTSRSGTAAQVATHDITGREITRPTLEESHA